MREHIELLASEFERRGMPAAEARLAAKREFGGGAQMEEIHRDQRRLPFLDTLAQDLRYALRQVRANPGFAAATVLTLALGIGANTAIFRVLDAVVLRSLPVAEPERLVLLEGSLDGRGMAFSEPLFRAMAAKQQSAEGMLATAAVPIQTASALGPEPLAGVKVRLASGGYFRVLGVNARLGRVFEDADDRPSAEPVAVISHALWQRAFGGKVDALGRRLQINKAVVTVVGVAPAGFFGEQLGEAPDIWLPLSLAPQVWLDMRSPGVSMLSVMARLRPGVSIAQAQAALDGLYRQLHGMGYMIFGARNIYSLRLTPGSQGLRKLQEKFSQPLGVLMGIAGLILLIACCNLANLLLARATARAHEIGVRLALGAARGRIVRQLLTESLMLTAVGSLFGIAISVWGSRELIALAAAGVNWRIPMGSGWRLLAFTTLVSAAAACLFGLVPALMATRLDLNSALQGSRRTQTPSRSRRMASRVFVVAQVSVSLLLVATASLLVRSFWNLERQDFGYRQEGVLMVRLRLDFSTLRLQDQSIWRPLYTRLNGLPGVRSAAIDGMGPLSSIQSPAALAVPDRPAQETDDARMASVSPRYFETMGIPIVAGRSLTEDDRKDGIRVAVLTETAARRLFGGANPIGRFVTLGKQFDAKQAVEIVGVARDLRFSGPRDPDRMLIFEPLVQRPAPLTSVAVRTAGDPAALAAQVRQLLRDAAPRLQIADVKPLALILDGFLTQEKMMALLSGAFGLLALLLASVGLYGVISYGVERRTQEIGLRLALGAARLRICGMLLREVLAILVIGLALGCAGTLVLGKYVETMLFGLTPRDPFMLGAAAALLSAVALLAGFLPARRAARLHPMDALRQE